jgi:hypothetical protein
MRTGGSTAIIFQGVLAGFNYASHCHGWESCHIYSLTRWMAIKVGERKTRFSKDDVEPNVFKEPVPFMVYDGYESWPILIVPSVKAAMRLPKKNRWCATDKYGVYVAPEVNHILTHFAEEAFFDPKLYEKMSKDWAKLGARPDYNKDRAGYETWMEKREAVKVKHTRPEVDKMLPLVRAEVKRLDKLWEAQA